MKKLTASLLVILVFCTLLLPLSANAAQGEKKFGVILGMTEPTFLGYKILFEGTDGGECAYSLADRLIWNGDRCADAAVAEELNTVLENEGIVKAAYRLNAGEEISWIDFEQVGEESYWCEDALYNAEKRCFTGYDEERNQIETTQNLPVYMDDGSNSEIYIDENHIYDIWVSRLGVRVRSFKAKDAFECTLSGIESGDYVDDNFSARIDVYGNISCDSIDASFISETKVVSEVYDKDGNFIEKNESNEIWEEWEYLCFDAVVLDNLDTFGKEYTIKIHLENESGEAVSPTYTVRHKMRDYKIKYGYLKDAAISDELGGDIVEVSIMGVEGNEIVSQLDSRLYLIGQYIDENGGKYTNNVYITHVNPLTKSNLDEYIPVPACVKYLSHHDGYDDEIIRVLSLDNAPQRYTDAEYNAGENAFICGGETIPVENVYCDKKVLYSEEHLYDISVYEYGVFVNGWCAKNYPCYIESLTLSNGLDGEYKNGVDVEWYASGEGFECIKAELYKSNGQKIGEQTSEVEWLRFGDLPNEACEYTLKLQLLNAGNQAVSPIYEVKYNSRYCEILYGNLWDKGIMNTLGGDIAEIKTTDSNGEEKIYTLAYKVSINGGSFVKGVDEIENIPLNSLVKFALNSQGNIHRLDYDNEVNETYAGVEYDKGTNCFLKDGAEIPALPIYYDMCYQAYLNENHLYDIEVYDTGINVTNYYAKDKEYTVKDLYVENFRNKQFKHCLGVYGNIYSYNAGEGISLLSGTGSNLAAKITIKNYKNQIVTEENVLCEDEWLDYSVEVPNNKEEYSVSVELLQNGEAVSYTYEESHTVEPVEIKYGQIMPVNDYDGTYMVLINELGGYEYKENMVWSIFVNGERVKELTEPVYGKYFIEGRKITIETFRLIGVLYEDGEFVDTVVRSGRRVYDEETSFAYRRKNEKEYKVKLFAEKDGMITKIQ